MVYEHGTLSESTVIHVIYMVCQRISNITIRAITVLLVVNMTFFKKILFQCFYFKMTCLIHCVAGCFCVTICQIFQQLIVSKSFSVGLYDTYCHSTFL